jgi:dTDP-4-amino-4,6-dideoxygalactose transaminase
MISQTPPPILPILPADPQQNYHAHEEEIRAALQRVLESGRYIMAAEVAAFEQEFARYLGAAHVVGVASGTDALYLALRACAIGSGDAVLTVANTAVATVAAIELTGAQAVLVDVDPGTYNIDPDKLEDAVRAYTRSPGAGKLKAIVPVHLYGHPADLEAILEVAKRRDLSVIEDCAQAHGASWRGKKTGGWGRLAAFSFYPTKNLGALGDGGAVATNDRELAAKLRLLREYGWKQRYISHIPGTNSRLDELQAAILRVKLAYLDEENRRRQQLAALYDRHLAHTGLVLPQAKQQAEHVYHQYVIRSQDRDSLRAYLNQNGVHTLIHYPLPIHLQPAYRGRIRIAPHGLPQTESLCQEILSLPMHPQLTEQQVTTVAHLIGSRASGGG